MTNAYFISDAHLSCNPANRNDERHKKIASFLDKINESATHLYIVGDFFDFWFEYKYTIPKGHFDTLYAIKKMSEQGVEMHYLAGNHDFALGSFFDEYLDIKTWQGDFAFELDSKKFYLFHGDGVVRNDTAYRMLRRILRNPFNQKFFRWIHPDVGMPLARLVSGTSRKYTNQMNEERDEKDYIEFAEQKFKEGYNYVMMGHRHNPLIHNNDENIYINLGDWINKFTYAHFDGKELTLQTFED